jgi:hypothetical protein
VDILLFLLLLLTTGVAIYFAITAAGARQTLGEANRALAHAQHSVAALSQQLATLQDYAQRTHRTLGETTAALTQAQSAAATLTQQLAAAQAYAQRLRRYETIPDAEAAATRILAEANHQAEQTAANALAAQRDAKRLEQTAQAMKNVIDGYGDRYVLPTAGLLDELAEQLAFAEAGQKLKAARGKARDMIADGEAATCDYAEQGRRSTAIAFVLDAFNGKVDTLLADVRHDNFGTLQQKIRDAFLLVNQGGRAFREARILPAYLDARLDELHWAVIAHQLKLREREEQKALKERIREEERVQRELEKARKDAEKEEEMLRKAMEKARRDVDKATDVERAAFELKLRELTDRLHAAEEKNQRALSMAQQTRSGHVYVISNIGSFGEQVYKIGMTRRLEPLDRVRELGDASVPFEFDVHALIPSDDAPALEHALHQRFVRSQVNKVNPRKEFFRLPLEELRRTLEEMQVAAAWMLTAAAREYRETLAIEQAFASKTLDEGAWAEQQRKIEAAMETEAEAIEAVA